MELTKCPEQCADALPYLRPAHTSGDQEETRECSQKVITQINKRGLCSGSQ